MRAAARRAASARCRGDYRILVVDDNSPDGTGAIADALAAEPTAVEVLHRPGKSGLGQAYLAGFAHALAGGAELVIEMDADFSHDPRYLAGAAGGRRGCRSRARVALRARRRGARLGAAAAADQPRRRHLRAA